MRPVRRGYTLFELIVVVALIVVLASLAIPSIQSMYADSKLQAAVDQVSGKWAQMRTRAILEGRPYRFAVGANGSDFRVAPDDAQYWGGGDPPAPSDPANAPLVVQGSLPHGIQFTQSDTVSTNPYDALNPPPSSSSGAWTTVAVFLPDGTAQQDVEIVFRMTDCSPVSLRLRALTGGVTSRRLRADDTRDHP